MTEILPPLLGLFVGLALGALFAGLFARARAAAMAERLAAREDASARLQAETADLRRELELARAALAAGRTELATERATAAEKIAALTEAQHRAATEFKALSAAALQANNSAFLELARETLGRGRQLADADLEKRQLAIDSLVRPLRDTLAQVETKLAAFDQSRAESTAALGEQLRGLAQTQLALQTETARLAGALRSTAGAGTWGELQLRRVVELAGMSDYCDFVEQSSTTATTPGGTFETGGAAGGGGGGGRLRPDLLVRLPGGQTIVVDAKAPNEAYREAASAPDETLRAAKLAEHAAKVRGHVDALGAKAYWEHFQPSPEFVVLFLPGDQFLAGALSADPGLIERAIAKKVLLATPATLIALLRAAAYGWRQDTAARNAEAISAQARELHDRVAGFLDHFARVAPALENAAKAYNAAVGSLESRVLPAGRRLAELGAKGAKELPAGLPLAETTTRQITGA